MTQSNVCIVVLNWNRPRDTLECLVSLAKQTYANLSILLVDNGSTDESVEIIRNSFPEITMLENRSNLGYSEGNNRGIRFALAHRYSYILLLNNDTVSDPRMVEYLVETAEGDPDIAAVGPKILYFDDPERIWLAGGKINYTETISKPRGYRQIDRGQFDVIEEVDFISGCAMLLKRDAVECTGLLDPIYSPAYFEDADWCMRARKKGYRIVYQPRAKVWHKVSASSGGEYNPQERYLIGYNAILFMKRYARPQQWAKFLLFAFGSLPFVFFIRVFQKRGRAVIAKGIGMFDGIIGSRKHSFLAALQTKGG